MLPRELTTQRSLLDASVSWRPAQLADVWGVAEARWVGGLLEDRQVLDVNPGHADATRELSVAAASLAVVTLRAALSQVLADQLPGVEVQTADPTALPFEDGSVEVVTCLSAGRLQTAETARVVSEIARVVAPLTGFVVLSLGAAHARRPEWGPDDELLAAMLRDHFAKQWAVEVGASLAVTFADPAADQSSPGGADATPIDTRPGPGRVLDTVFVASNGRLPDLPAPRALSFPIDAILWQESLDTMLEATRLAQARALTAEDAGGGRAQLLGELFLVEQRLSEEFDRRRRNEVSAKSASLFHDQLEAARAQRSRVDELERETARLHAAVRGANDQIAELKSSTSWLITKPLRALKQLMR